MCTPEEEAAKVIKAKDDEIKKKDENIKLIQALKEEQIKIIQKATDEVIRKRPAGHLIDAERTER